MMIVSDEKIIDSAKRILSGNEYKREFYNPLADTAKKIMQFFKDRLEDIGDFIDRLIPHREFDSTPRVSTPDVHVPNMMEYLPGIIITLVVIAVVVGVFLFYYKKMTFKNLKAKMEEDEELLLTLKDFDEVEALAVRTAESGDYAKAVRYLYLALLLKFNEGALIEIERAKTNRQYMRELAASQFAMVREAEDFTLKFNYLWYGEHKTDMDGFLAQKQQYELLRNGVMVKGA